MKADNTFYSSDRKEWRHWLEEHFKTKKEIWLIYPMKGSGEERIAYNDAVEEALCFGWIDSTNKNLDEFHRAQRFTPRRKGSEYSRPNVERLIWLNEQNMIHPDIIGEVQTLINTPYEFPTDIIEKLKEDDEIWRNFNSFSEPYKRIRVAYIDAARKRPEEFEKRMKSFLEKTRQNKLIVGFGGIDKYYK